jgi:hypothetical protein
MAGTPFDPTEAVTFDLQLGHVHLEGAPARLMVPADALVTLCGHAGADAAAAFARSIGAAMGARAGARLGGGDDPRQRAKAVRSAGYEGVVGQLAGEFAVMGFGALGAERWGGALVFVHDESPLDANGDDVVAGILEGALQTLTGRPAKVVALVREDNRARFLVTAAQTLPAVKAKIARGDSWGAVLAALNRKPSA